MSSESGGKTRLETWKEVAAFFRKDERTVKRWEADRGLPIHRLPGKGRSRIFALVPELETWRAGGSAQTEAEGMNSALSEPPVVQDSPPEAIQRWRRPTTGLAAIAAMAALTVAIFTGTRMIERSRPPSLDAQRYYVAATDHWAQRTPESLNWAIGEYNAAIARDPDYAEAYAGLASTYDLLREYTHVPAAQAYPLARAAARRALALDDRLASAHAALAFAEYWGFWNAPTAAREFERAIALDPRSATAQQWYATFLSATGNQPGALAHIDAATMLDPHSPAIAADRGLILFLDGHESDGLVALKSVEHADPDFLSAHVYLAEYYLGRGEFADYVAEARRAGELTGDDEDLKTVAMAERSLDGGGPAAFLRTLQARQLDRFRNGQVSAFSVAYVCAVAGDQPRALTFLRVSLDRRETELMGARGNDAFGKLRTRPEFAHIIAGATPLNAS